MPCPGAVVWILYNRSIVQLKFVSKYFARVGLRIEEVGILLNSEFGRVIKRIGRGLLGDRHGAPE